MKKLVFSLSLIVSAINLLTAQVKIGDNPNIINAASILELESSTKGFLIPQMSTIQRDAIISPPNGLQIYDTTTNHLNIYRVNQWETGVLTNPLDNLVYVYSLADLPNPSGGEITLDATKMYVFTGIVNISPNYLNLNGANLRGNDPTRDGVMSSVSGGILRSSNVSVFMENLAVLPIGGAKAYDFTDATGTKFCNIFSGCSVVEVAGASLGVGQVSGFKAITINKNYWNCSDGIKITGFVGKLSFSFNYITGISAGSGIEFLSGLIIDDIDLANNYFIYSGQTGVKINSGTTIDFGRMNTNMFRGVSTLLSGFDSFTPGWEMMLNTGIPNTRSYGYIYFNNNTTSTSTLPDNTYKKVDGITTATTLHKFTSILLSFVNV